jgi:hypothetical protein
VDKLNVEEQERLSIFMQAGIINDIATFSESFASTSDHAHVYVVAKIQHLSLSFFMFSSKSFLFVLPDHGEGTLLEVMGVAHFVREFCVFT